MLSELATIQASRACSTAIRTLRGAGLGLVALVAGSLTPAAAQSGIVFPGNAVVTGYSGTIPGETPDGEDPADYLSIDIGGPSARVVDLSSLGPQGQLSEAAKPFTITAGQVGQVFGVALDNAPQPNIYLAAGSAYGISIYLPDETGVVRRIASGTPGAQFVPGQFGPPELGGSPGAVWRVDGATGEVSLLTTLGYAAQGVAALGGLAFDARTQQLFAVERSTGIIYRMALDGSIQGTYDHGEEGRPTAGLAPFPLGVTPTIDINSPSFDSQNPGTWGFAPPPRRTFGLAVHNNRLYYSIAQGPQVWSVGINANGSLGPQARFEVDVPAMQDGIEISSIAFDGQNRMYLAERGAPTGDFQLVTLANGGTSRVLRFLPKPAGDPDPGLWKLTPDQYAVGFPPIYDNADGGVALGYGYRTDGQVNLGSCRGTLWSTGERLLDPGDPSMPPDSYPAVDGLQGNAPALVMPQNEPPAESWFVDYDDRPGDPGFRGFMGAVVTLNPCATPIYVPPPPPPVIICPPGTVYSGGACVVTVRCPAGSHYRNGYCVYDDCPPGYVRYKNVCVPPPISCPFGQTFFDGKCVPLDCPPGMKRLPSGYCVCPPNNTYYNGKCVPPSFCPPGMVQLPGGICWCPLETIFENGQCQPIPCPKGYYQDDFGQCVPNCPPWKKLPNGQCNPCPSGQVPTFDGTCVPNCPPWDLLPNGMCNPCPDNMVPGFGGTCVPACQPGEELFKGACFDKCFPPTTRQPDGSCGIVLNLTCILLGKENFQGQCVDPCPVGLTRQPNGSCASKNFVDPAVTCLLSGKEMFKGKCLNPCPPGKKRQPDATCGAKTIVDAAKACSLAGKVMFNGSCVARCVPPQVRQPNGSCAKPPLGAAAACAAAGKVMFAGKCVARCVPPQVRQPDGSCKKPIADIAADCVAAGKVMFAGKCVAKCVPPQVRQPDGSCKKPIADIAADCVAAGKVMFNGKCVAKCVPPQVRQPNGSCAKPPLDAAAACAAAGKVMFKGACVAKCVPPKTRQPDGSCAKPPLDAAAACAAAGKVMFKGACVAKCVPPKTRQPDGSCATPAVDAAAACAAAGKVMFKGTCVAKCVPPKTRQPDGSCAKPAVDAAAACAAAGKVMFKGACVAKCVPPKTRQPDGTCKAVAVAACPPGQSKNANDKCVCDAKDHVKNGKGECVCPQNQIERANGTCGCPAGLVLNATSKKCVPKSGDYSPIQLPLKKQSGLRLPPEFRLAA